MPPEGNGAMRVILRNGGLPSGEQLGRLAAGGVVGLTAWELFANLVTPVFVGGPLQPPALITSLIQNWTGIVVPWALAVAIHWTTGVLLYPLGYWFTSRWLVSLGTLGDGLLWGVVTWILALGVFATLAGLPFMLGFIPLTWFSLIGHVLYAALAVAVAERGRRAPAAGATLAARPLARPAVAPGAVTAPARAPAAGPAGRDGA